MITVSQLHHRYKVVQDCTNICGVEYVQVIVEYKNGGKQVVTMRKSEVELIQTLQKIYDTCTISEAAIAELLTKFENDAHQSHLESEID